MFVLKYCFTSQVDIKIFIPTPQSGTQEVKAMASLSRRFRKAISGAAAAGIIIAIICVIIAGVVGYYYGSSHAKPLTVTHTVVKTVTKTVSAVKTVTSTATVSAATTTTSKSLAGASIIWASTQLVPPEEQAFVKGTLLTQFKQKTGISVTFVGLSYSEMITRITAAEKSGKVSISLIGDLHGDLDLMASKGYLMDLSSYFKTLTGRTFPKVLLNYAHLHGILAYIPWMTATYVMVINKKAFKYLPPGLTEQDIISGDSKWTYQALLAWAKNLYEKTGKKLLGFPAGPHGLFVRFLHGYLYPAFTGAQVKNFNSTAAVQMWKYLKELWKYVNPASTTWDAMADPLLSGQVWIAWDHTARIKDAIEKEPNQFVVVPVPQGPKGRGFILVVAGLAIPKGAPNPQAAWRLIEYLTNPSVQVEVLKKTGFFPTVKEASTAMPSGPLKVLIKGVTDQISAPNAVVAMIPSLGSKSGDFKSIYITAFRDIVLNNQPIQKVLNELYPQLLNLFKETGAPLPPPDSGSAG